MWILLIETVIITMVFNLVIFIPLCKNQVWWIHNYPKDIQEEYFKTHERIPVGPLSKTAIIKKEIFIFVAFILLVGLISLAQAKTFLDVFLYTLSTYHIKIIFSDLISINIYNMTHSCHITLDIL